MPNTTALLAWEYKNNDFKAYTYGFYRSVKLSDDKRAEIAKIVEDISGMKPLTIANKISDNMTPPIPFVNMSQMIDPKTNKYVENKDADYASFIPAKTSYSEFKKKMTRVDDIIGGKSAYATDELSNYGGYRPVTYEEKLAEWNAFTKKDMITGAYARVYCDYMGIVIGLLAVFIPVSFLLRDKRAKMGQLIMSRRISSQRIVLPKYFAAVTAITLPFLILSLSPLFQFACFSLSNDIAIDWFAFVKYIFAWLFPTICTVCATSFLLTVLTDSMIAIPVQVLWGLFSILTTDLSGDYGLGTLFLRHNTVGERDLLMQNMDLIVANRVFYCLIPVLMIFFTIIIYERKGKGLLRFNLSRMFSRRRNSNADMEAI
jgi:hypothetical protein